MLTIVPVILFVCFTTMAHANGRKPIGAVAVKSTIETLGGQTNELFNVRLANGTNDLMELEAKSGGAKQIIKLSRIDKIIYVGISTSDTNYAAFDVFMNHSDTSNRFELKIMDNGNPLNLKGHTRDETIFEVPVAACKMVIFSPQGKLHEDPNWPVHTGEAKK